MNTCSYCQTTLSDKIGFVFCTKCNAPHFLGKTTTPFDVLGFTKNFELSSEKLEQTYYSLSKLLHPDHFTLAPQAIRLKSQELSSLLNQSFAALRNRESRLETLLMEARVWNPEDQKTEQKQIPTELTEEFFDLQEALMEDPVKAKVLVQEFKKKLATQNESLTNQIYELARKIDWLTPSKETLEKILEFRRKRSYIQSMIENLKRYHV